MSYSTEISRSINIGDPHKINLNLNNMKDIAAGLKHFLADESKIQVCPASRSHETY